MMKYTKAQIKAEGGRRFFKRRMKRIALLYVMSIAWIFLINFFMAAPKTWILFAPMILVTINVIWSYNTSRNIFYQKVKKNPEIMQK